MLFPIGEVGSGEMTSFGARGIELQASGGDGGWRVAAGLFSANLPLWTADVLLTVTRTTADARGALPESTYVGVEAGIRAYVWTFGRKSCSGNCRHVVLSSSRASALPIGLMDQQGRSGRCSPGAPALTRSR